MFDFKLTTKTVVAKTNVIFNLDAIFNFLKCDDDIKSMKYNNQLKTSGNVIQNQKSFFNQITFKLNKSETNIKIFKNNKIQITGVKSIKEARDKLEILLPKFQKIYGVTTDLDLEIRENLFMDEKCNIYDKGEYRIIGVKNKDGYYIMGKNELCVLDNDTGLFMGREYKKCVKNIYFYNGEIIGKREIVFSGKKYYLKKGVYINDKKEIIKYGEVIGNEKTSYSKSIEEIESMKTDWLNGITNKVKYNAFYGVLDVKNIEYETRMSNYIIDTLTEIDRENLNTSLLNSGFSSTFDPWCYKGVNIKLFFNENDSTFDGICRCEKKCTCSKTTLLVFRTGKIIISCSASNTGKIKDVISDIFQTYILKINLEKTEIIFNTPNRLYQ